MTIDCPVREDLNIPWFTISVDHTGYRTKSHQAMPVGGIFGGISDSQLCTLLRAKALWSDTNPAAPYQIQNKQLTSLRPLSASDRSLPAPALPRCGWLRRF